MLYLSQFNGWFSISILTTAKDWRTYRALLRADLHSYQLFANPIESTKHLHSAKKLHAEVYLRRGFISQKDINSYGWLSTYADPHQEHAQYFMVTDGTNVHHVIAAARQIAPTQEKGFGSFPVLAQARIDPAEMRRIKRHRPEDFVEISALVKRSGANSLPPLFLYRAMWQHSLRNNHKYWLMACDVRLYKRLKMLFGSAITQIGEVTPYYGGDVIPAKLELRNSVPAMLKEVRKGPILHRGVRFSTLKFILEGLTRDDVTKQQWSEMLDRELIDL